MSLIDDMKNQIKKSGANKGKFLYFKPGVKVRIRFLQDMDDGMKVLFHDSYAAGINVPCQELFDRECEYCNDEELRHRDMYLWSVWDYEAKEVKILMYAVNNCSPIPALISMYETYGTLIDRDYVLTRNGQGQNTTFGVVPMDKAKFRNPKAKPFSESKVLTLLDKAYPADGNNDNDEEEDEDEKPAKKHSSKNSKSKHSSKGSKRKPEPEPEEDEDDEEMDYEDMSPRELYALCKERGIKAKQKMDEEYYIEKLEEYDETDTDDEEGDEDEW